MRTLITRKVVLIRREFFISQFPAKHVEPVLLLFSSHHGYSGDFTTGEDISRITISRDVGVRDVKSRRRKGITKLLDRLIDVEGARSKTASEGVTSSGIVSGDVDAHAFSRGDVKILWRVILQEMAKRVVNRKRFRVNRLLDLVDAVTREDLGKLFFGPLLTMRLDGASRFVKSNIAPAPGRSISDNVPLERRGWLHLARAIGESKSCPLGEIRPDGVEDVGWRVPE